MQVSLNVGHGTLTLAGSGGLTFDAGADMTANMTFSGTLTNVNTALSTLTCTPAYYFFGPDSLHVRVDDLGNFGSGGSCVVDAAIPVTVEGGPDVQDNKWEDAPTLTDGEAAFTGPLSTIGAMPDIGNWVELLSSQG